MEFQQLHTQRKFIMVGTSLGVMGLSPSWINYGSQFAGGMKSFSILAFILFILIGLIAQAGDEKANISKKMWLPVLSAGIINICIIAYLGIPRKSVMGDVTEKQIAMNGNVELFGLRTWIALAGAALIVYGAYKYRSSKSNFKNS